MHFLGIDPSLWDSSYEENANRSSDRSVERRIVRIARNVLPLHALIQKLPSSWKSWSVKNIATKQLKLPVAELSVETKQKFIDYVAEDAHGFLAMHGKPLELWGEMQKKNLPPIHVSQ